MCTITVASAQTDRGAEEGEEYKVSETADRGVLWLVEWKICGHREQYGGRWLRKMDRKRWTRGGAKEERGMIKRLAGESSKEIEPRLWKRGGEPAKEQATGIVQRRCHRQGCLNETPSNTVTASSHRPAHRRETRAACSPTFLELEEVEEWCSVAGIWRGFTVKHTLLLCCCCFCAFTRKDAAAGAEVTKRQGGVVRCGGGGVWSACQFKCDHYRVCRRAARQDERWTWQQWCSRPFSCLHRVEKCHFSVRNLLFKIYSVDLLEAFFLLLLLLEVTADNGMSHTALTLPTWMLATSFSPWSAREEENPDQLLHHLLTLNRLKSITISSVCSLELHFCISKLVEVFVWFTCLLVDLLSHSLICRMNLFSSATRVAEDNNRHSLLKENKDHKQGIHISWISEKKSRSCKTKSVYLYLKT